jgi:glyoxylase-like metal-dependent hydrolase (beta-lactamase superfamily II)
MTSSPGLRTLLTTMALAIPTRTLAQGTDSVRITSTAVTEGVSMLQGSGGNIGVSAGRDGVLVIDDEYAPLSERIKAAVHAITPAMIRYVVNTHWHGDHTGGNENFARDGAVLVAQENVRRRMSREQFLAAFDEKVPASPAAALPTITFSDTLTFYFNDDTVEVVHVNAAHTDGDAFIVFHRANVIHAGDVFFNGLYPFIDVSTGGSLDGMITAADRILARCNPQTRIIPGHGPLADPAALRRYREMLATVRLRLGHAARQGLTTEQAVSANLLADLDPTWGKGFLTPAEFVAVIYPSLAGR